MEGIANDLGIEVPALIAVALLTVAQLAIQVFALIDLFRRPQTAHLPKVVWALVVIFGGLVGTVVYLAIGRGQAEAAEDARPRTEDGRARARSAAEVLYGESDETGSGESARGERP